MDKRKFFEHQRRFNPVVIKTKEMLKKYKFFTKDVCKDLSGNNRCIIAIKL